MKIQFNSNKTGVFYVWPSLCIIYNRAKYGYPNADVGFHFNIFQFHAYVILSWKDYKAMVTL